LDDAATRASAISALQSPSADLFYSQSILPSAHDLLADYPALAAAFASHARLLPEALTPRAAQLRKSLDLPEWK